MCPKEKLCTSVGAAATTFAAAGTGSCTELANKGLFPVLLHEPSLMMFSIDDMASLACSCSIIISLWHFEHMFMVAALPKKPQLLTQRIGPSGAWQLVSFDESISSISSQLKANKAMIEEMT